MTAPFPTPDPRAGRGDFPVLVRAPAIEQVPVLRRMQQTGKRAAPPAPLVKQESNPTGTLFVVGTPIGNLGDVSRRTIETLQACDEVACEDTRVTGKLLRHLEIRKPLFRYHDHNEPKAAEALLELLQSGKSIALVSDAGTPAISDPGFRIVRACHCHGIKVVPIPGPSSLLAALSASGLPSDRFEFIGFLAPKSAARKRFLTSILEVAHTVILFESCHRIEKLLREMRDLLPATRQICVAREVTKFYESIISGSLDEVIERVLSGSLKGEFVVIIAGCDYRP